MVGRMGGPGIPSVAKALRDYEREWLTLHEAAAQRVFEIELRLEEQAATLCGIGLTFH